MLSLIGLFINTFSQIHNDNHLTIGGQLDNHNCIISSGYSWCQDSQSCIRIWETPCQDYYNDCGDCLKRQSHGQNIACPVDCNSPTPHTLPVIPPTPVPIVFHSCPQVMCEIYCENGKVKDTNGCDTCSCNDKPLVVINPFQSEQSNVCSSLQNSVIHRCNSDCHNCDFDDTQVILNECLDMNGNVAYNSLCSEVMINNCPIQYDDCDSEYVCPKITEITECGDGGIDGYTTYQLSLVVKNDNVKNIYAIFGSDETGNNPLIIPPAYQGDTIFNNNIGGIDPQLIAINSDSQFDSWLTISLTNGDPNNKLSAIGIDFNSWTTDTGINTVNGAVFVMNPEETITTGDEYIVAQLTIPNDLSYEVLMNAQGKKINFDSSVARDNSWSQTNIIFNISPPQVINVDMIPNNCKSWYDGCNTCQVINGEMGACTRQMCFRNDNSRCLLFNVNGH